jgi:hypothetical protein
MAESVCPARAMKALLMILLGASIAVPLLVVDEALLKRSLKRGPGPLPPWPSVICIALTYAGWMLLVALRGTQDGLALGGPAFAAAEMTYGVVHLEVVLYLLQATRHWMAEYIGPVWLGRNGRLVPLVLCAAFAAGSVFGAFGPNQEEAPIVSAVASAFALLATFVAGRSFWMRTTNSTAVKH